MYVVITMNSLNEIQDLEILDHPPSFSNRVEESEDAFHDLRLLVFHGNVNGGDSVELHWNEQTGEWHA